MQRLKTCCWSAHQTGKKAGKYRYNHYTTGLSEAPKGQAPCWYSASRGMPQPAVGTSHSLSLAHRVASWPG